jgi:putative ABC transport system permease protein
MLNSLLKSALRHIRFSKIYTLINILGLSLGMGCSILIFSLISYHLNFDKFHVHQDRIYRIVTEFHQEGVGYSQRLS